MRFQFLPSTIRDGKAENRQHLVCMLVDDRVAFDAGSLAMSVSADQRNLVRDVVLSHAHLDHIAGLPLFIDDLFSTLDVPVVVHALSEVIETLEEHVFNWRVYPRFSELRNGHGTVLEYRPFQVGHDFDVAHLRVKPVAVNHSVASCGFVISGGGRVLASTGDTASGDGFWREVNALERLDALIVECAFPDRLGGLAETSHHLTPSSLASELAKLERPCERVIVGNIKPMFFEEVCGELREVGLGGLEVLEVGKIYSV